MRDTITVVGTIGTSPELQTSEDGRPFLNFRLATNHSWQDSKTREYVDGEPNWFTVKAFRTLAVNAHASLGKGQRVIVRGRLQVRNWTHEDRSGTRVEVMADHIGHDLALGTARYAKMTGQTTTGSTEATPAGADASGSNSAVPDSAASEAVAASERSGTGRESPWPGADEQAEAPF